MTVAAVVLAAGAGERFDADGHKLLAQVRGRSLVRSTVDAALAAGFDETVVIEGALALGAEVPDGVTIVRNDRWPEGQATSLRAAVAHAEQMGHDAIVVGLADMPGVPASAWRKVGTSAADLATAVFDGAWRPPVKIASRWWPDLPIVGDEGARRLLSRHRSEVQEIACAGDPADVDTVEDLRRWT